LTQNNTFSHFTNKKQEKVFIHKAFALFEQVFQLLLGDFAGAQTVN